MACIGYARVSTHEQNLDLQIDKLKEKGCLKIFTDEVSGAKFDRKELEAALAYVRPGDVLVVWKLDRLGRSLQHLIEILNALKTRDIGFVSLTESIDTTTPGGKLIFHIMGALAEFERDLIRERTLAGLVSARARGKKGGRKPLPIDNDKVMLAKIMYTNQSMTIGQICNSLNISRATFYRYVNKGKDKGATA